MKVIHVSQIQSMEHPLFHMKNLFDSKGDFSSVKVNLLTIPGGSRIPPQGSAVHVEDEFSFILEGEIYSHGGDTQILVKKGMATLIPGGEEFWCHNQSENPCIMISVMVK